MSWAVSANQNSSRSSGSKTPSSTMKSISTARPPPVALADQNDRDRPDLAGLDQGEDSEQLIERAETPGKRDQRSGPQQKMHLAQREIAKAEAEPGRNVGIRILLVGQADIQTDCLGAGIERAPVG